MMPDPQNELRSISRRAILKSIASAPLFMRAAPFLGLGSPDGSSASAPGHNPDLPFADVRLTPHYPSPSPLTDVMRLVAPGSDDYIAEKYAFEIEAILNKWGEDLKASPGKPSTLANFLSVSIQGCSLT